MSVLNKRQMLSCVFTVQIAQSDLKDQEEDSSCHLCDIIQI